MQTQGEKDIPLVWTATLDDRYVITVSRTDENSGSLRIVDSVSGNELHTAPVTLSYGALFGPDIDDVQEWQEIAVGVVDALPTR
jgi:hypothetical protein